MWGTTILLGAGFSESLGIAGTAKIGCEIDAALCGSVYGSPYRSLRDRLRWRFRAAYNFEVLMGALESCMIYGRPGLLPDAPEYRSVIPEIATLREGLTPLDAASMYEIAIRIVQREVGKDWRSGIAPQAAAASQWFFGQLSSHWKLSVATLNYDDGADSLIPNAVDGFVGDGDLQSFDSQTFLANDARPRVAHVHGSLAFGITEIGKRFVKNVGPLGTRRELMWTERLDGIIWTAIVTGADKPDKLILQPYSVYYVWLATAMLQSPRIIIAGYGMGDLHINAWLANATQHHQGADYRLVIIDNFAGDTVPRHLADIFALGAGFQNQFDAQPALAALRFRDDIATHGPAMILRGGLPITTSQVRAMLDFLA